jgi:tetratricopeptide (TPR) repeat protein
VFFAAPSYAETDKINASNNAEMHNNWGVNYLEEGDYFAAIKEFKIAIALNPSKQNNRCLF